MTMKTFFKYDLKKTPLKFGSGLIFKTLKKCQEFI